MEHLEWIYDLRSQISEFIASLRHPDTGRYNYSLTGDRISNSLQWGLGQAVFVSKVCYMLDILEENNRNELINFINSFQNADGSISDPEIERLSRLRRLANAIRNRNINNIFNEQTKRAETRQAFAALRCLEGRPEIPYENIPYTEADIEKHILSFNWRHPWDAGSHVSHLLFFLNNNRRLFNLHTNDADGLIEYALDITNRYQQKDGAWYAPGELPVYQKVNGAMKIMTAYEAAERNDFDNPEGLIDLCLSTINDGHACNNFNIVCVLYHCSRKTGHRKAEIESYYLNRLKLYREHYWPDHGGFSFFKRKANDIYYGARISKGLAEPDIHGTVLFLWGIVLIADFLNIRKDLGLRIPFT